MRVSFSLTSNHVSVVSSGGPGRVTTSPRPCRIQVNTKVALTGQHRHPSSSDILMPRRSHQCISIVRFFPILKIHAPALCPRGGRDKQPPPLQGTSDANRTTASPLIKRHFNASTRTSLHFDLQVFFSHSQHSRSRLMPEGGNRQEISFLAGCK